MAHDAAFVESNNQQREMRALGTNVRLLSVKVALLKRRGSAICNMEVTTRKVADGQGNKTDTVTGLHRDTVSSYNTTR